MVSSTCPDQVDACLNHIENRICTVPPKYRPHTFNLPIFDGNFYTGYQSYLFDKHSDAFDLAYENLDKCSLNQAVWNQVKDSNFVILSSGITYLWQRIAKRFGIEHCLASPLVSADTKYYVAKLLCCLGYSITAFGDSKNDVFMLKEADIGNLCIANRLSRSLNGVDVSTLNIICQPHAYVLDRQSCSNHESIKNHIAVCKSSSGITGSKLAEAHYELGKELGHAMRRFIPNTNVPVVILERGGRFFGNGVYIGFGGKCYPYNPKKDDLPELNSNLVVIVDSVINTGNSMVDLISKLKESKSSIKVYIVANVIQSDAVAKLSEYSLFAVRISDNKFVGKRQKVQIGNSGPDTADRLFNLIDD